jgi:hypothetical protein
MSTLKANLTALKISNLNALALPIKKIYRGQFKISIQKI